MYEVFNVRTCETIGYVDNEISAAQACLIGDLEDLWLDFINADEESSGVYCAECKKHTYLCDHVS